MTALVPSCKPDSPIPCAPRKAAMEREDFRYVDGLGWVWWRSRVPITPWHRCPWCWGELPTMQGAVERLLREPSFPDGWIDGEGQE